MFTRYPYFTGDNVDLMAMLVARQIEDVVALGREYGIRYPAQYAVGFNVIEDPSCDGRCEVRIRIDETRHTYRDRWIDAVPARFFDNLRRQADLAIRRWAAANTFTDPATARQMLERMETPEWRAQAAQRAAEAMRKATFTRVR